MYKIKSNLKKTIEISFIIVVIFSFMLWGYNIFVKGVDSEQISLFFSRMGDFWADFLNTVGYCAQRDPYNNLSYVGWEHKQYPPLAYVLFYVFSRFIVNIDYYYNQNYFLDMYKEPLFLYMMLICHIFIFIVLFELLKAYKNGGKLFKVGTAAAILCSYPILYVLERGNNYLLTIVFVLIFFVEYKNENSILREIALIALAVAFGLKLSPAIFGMLLLYERRWKEAIRTAIYGIIVLFVPFMFFTDGINNFLYFIRNISISAQAHSPLSGISILGSFAYVNQILGIGYNLEDKKQILLICNYSICFLLSCFSFLYKKQWQKILALTLVALSISGQAGGYSSLLFIPFVVSFLNEEKHRIIESIVILIAIFMVFCPYRISNNIWDIHVGVLIMLCITVCEGMYLLIGKLRIISNTRNV